MKLLRLEGIKEKNELGRFGMTAHERRRQARQTAPSFLSHSPNPPSKPLRLKRIDGRLQWVRE